MSDYIHLIGAEQVQRAGYEMSSAAHEMWKAANLINSSVRDLIQTLTEFTGVFSEYLERLDKQGE